MTIRNFLTENPWRWVLIFLFPLVLFLAFAVYYSTLVPGIFPTHEESAQLLQASGLMVPKSLEYPIFHALSRLIGSMPWGTLPYRLHLFSAICTALASGFFFIWVIQLISYLFYEDPGGDQRLIFSQEGDDAEDVSSSYAVASNFPERIQKHNHFILLLSVVGGFVATLFFIFSPPIWVSATRLLPYGFELFLLFLLLTLFFAYLQIRSRFALYLCLFLSSLLWIESPIFLFLFPLIFAFFAYSLFLSEDRTFSFPVVNVFTLSFLGMAIGYVVLLLTSVLMGASLGYFRIFFVFLRSIAANSVELFTEFSALPSLLFFTLPIVLLFFLYPRSFKKRSFPFLFLQLLWIGLLVPVILNLDIIQVTSPTHVSALSVFNYTALAIGCGLLVTTWFSASENKPVRNEREEEEELAFVYGVRNNPFVIRIVPFFAALFSLFIIVMPFKSNRELFRDSGQNYLNVIHEISAQIHSGDWLIDTGDFRNLILLNEHLEGKNIHLLSLAPSVQTFSNRSLPERVKEDQSIPDSAQPSLQNAAEISPKMFVQKWMKIDPSAPQRGCFFSKVPLNEKKFNLIPCTFFLKGKKITEKVDWNSVIANHFAFLDRMEKYLLDPPKKGKRVFHEIHVLFANQVAFVGNEFACSLARKGMRKEALAVLQRSLRFDLENLAILFNCYYLNQFDGLPLENSRSILQRIKAIPEQLDLFRITNDYILQNYGHLIDLDVLAHIRKNIWLRNLSYESLKRVSTQQTSRSGMIFKTKGEELKPLVQKHLDQNQFDQAEELLDVLLDLDEKDPFVLINQCRIALLKKNLVDAGVWMDLAKEAKIPEEKLIWQKAAILMLEGKDQEAKKYINLWIPDHPKDIYLWGLLAEILQKEKNYVQLENRVYPAMRHATYQKDHYLFYQLKGFLAELRHNLPAARSAYLKTLELNPYLDETWNQLLVIDQKMDITNFSTLDSKNALAMNPKNPFAYYLFGLGRFRNNEIDLALDLFQRSYQFKKTADALAGIGACYFENGDSSRAIELLNQALKQNSKVPFAWNQLARVQLHLGKVQQATYSIEQALKLKKDFWDAKITQTAIWFKMGQTQKAEQQLAELVSGVQRLPLSLRLKIEKMEQEHHQMISYD